MSLQYHLLVPQLFGHVPRGASADLNPGLREQSATQQYKGHIDHGVNGVAHQFAEVPGRRDVIGDASNGNRVAPVHVLPLAQHAHQQEGLVPLVEYLREEVEVGHECGLQDNGDVGGVEELDRVGALLASDLLRADAQVHLEALEVDDDQEDEHGGQQAHDVGCVAAVEGLAQRLDLVLPRDQQVEQRDDGALELHALAGCDRGGAEGAPDHVLADVGGDEERDPRAQAVALLQELVQDYHDHACEKELQDDQDRREGTDVRDVAVHATHHVGHRLADRDQHAEQLLGALEQRSVLFQALVHVDDLGTGQQLHHHARGNYGRDTQLHERASITGHYHPHPVQRVRVARSRNPVQRNLAAHQKDEESYGCPYYLISELHSTHWSRHFWEHTHQRTNQSQESHLFTHFINDHVGRWM